MSEREDETPQQDESGKEEQGREERPDEVSEFEDDPAYSPDSEMLKDIKGG